jgi:hypothetical protein
MGNIKYIYRVLLCKSEERDTLEDLGVDRRIILKLALKKQDGQGWTGLLWLLVQTSGRLLLIW